MSQGNRHQGNNKSKCIYRKSNCIGSYKQIKFSNWHNVLGHPEKQNLQITLDALCIKPRLSNDDPNNCESCTLAKSTKAPLSKTKAQPAPSSSELLSVDILTQYSGHSACRFALVAIDQFSNYNYVCSLYSKGQATQALCWNREYIRRNSVSGKHFDRIERTQFQYQR